MSNHRRLAVVLASLADGGIGKMRLHLINEFIRHGVAVDLLLGHRQGPYLEQLSDRVRVIDLGTSHPWSSVPVIAWYLLRQRPKAVLTQRIRVNIAVLRARRLIGADMPVMTTLNTHLSRQLDSLRPRKRHRQLRAMRRYYPMNDGLIAISNGVADDAARLLGCPRHQIQTILNPVITPRMFHLAQANVPHPWFQPHEPPVILGVGRMEPQKDYPTLIRAFARLRPRYDCRLVILGEGKQRAELTRLARELSVDHAVDMPGFVQNPYAYMARSALFVLSSSWEGSGNALTEAVALGTPVVATDCPSGPREVLDDGRYGPLVPVGDDQALAAAMLKTLQQPLPAGFLRRAGQRYDAVTSAERYLIRLGLLDRKPGNEH